MSFDIGSVGGTPAAAAAGKSQRPSAVPSPTRAPSATP